MTIEQQLLECRKRIAIAVDDCIKGMRNAPHETLERELEKAKKLYLALDGLD